MTQDSTLLFSHIAPVKPPDALYAQILSAVALARARRLRTRFFVALTGLVTTMGYAVFGGFAWRTEWQASSFMSMVRLSISDPDVLFGNGQEYVFAVLETIPMGAITLVCAALFLGASLLAIGDGWRRARHSAIARFQAVR
ncbi:MAG: hypothetical protein WCV84_01570 [Patescibacteria group bacterium]